MRLTEVELGKIDKLPAMASSAHRDRLDRLGRSSSLSLTSNSDSSLQSSPSTSRQPSSGHVSSDLAPAWPFNQQETSLIRYGYIPAYKPTCSDDKSKPPTSKMAEPRARAPRHKGQMNFPTERMFLPFNLAIFDVMS